MHPPTENQDAQSSSTGTRASDAPPEGGATSEIEIDGSQAVAWLSGEIDVANAEQLRHLAGQPIHAPEVCELVIDLTSVTFLDSTGLGALVELRNRSGEAAKRFTLRGVPIPVARLLEITGLTEIFGLAPDDEPG